ncbi:thioredoxin family protein [Acaryochloris sp. CCMEE 5410]|uniref:thioredoxin family protein n=1 Tax=Acaryochloris sp. CCMEE 5410 TaxID=310037 RepID=UPI00024843E9|nr:thioredoxin family protein [Acaryochloris sp. CCMEE 5410]KAI9129921.1 thioredoxin family protein [Acaryochloris sp. CCMEE 5410]
MAKRQVEVFTAGCPLCDPAVQLIRELACNNCEVQVYDLRDDCATNVCRDKVTQYGIHRVPTVVVDGKLTECCQNQQLISRDALIAAGIGQS